MAADRDRTPRSTDRADTAAAAVVTATRISKPGSGPEDVLPAHPALGDLPVCVGGPDRYGADCYPALGGWFGTMRGIKVWAEAHMDEVQANRERFDGAAPVPETVGGAR